MTNEKLEIEMKVENQLAIWLMKKGIMNKRSKHIDVRYYYLKDQIDANRITAKYCSTGLQIADILIKYLPPVKFEKCQRKLVSEAAFEAVSSINVRPFDKLSILDFRFAKLPNEKPTDDYDPTKHRNPREPIKVWMAYFLILRTMFGAGVLGLPLAVSQGGIILGPIMTMGLGLLIMHMHYTLLWCLNEISRQLKIPYISYKYGFRVALLHGPLLCRFIGRSGPKIIAVFMLLSQLGICTVFVIFTTDSLRDIVDWSSSKPAIAALLIPYLLLLYFMKTLKIVGYISLMGNILNIIGMSLVVYHIFNEQHGDVVYATSEPLKFFFVVGTSLFNLSAVGVILSINKALKDPTLLTRPHGILNTQMFLTCLMSTVFGALGYWAFGTMEENVLRSLPFDEITAMTAIGLYLVAIAFAYPIQCYPAIEIIVEAVKNWDPYRSPTQEMLDTLQTVARPLFVLTTFLVSYLIPVQGALVAFVGNLCTTLLALVFPALMEICILYPNDYGRFKIYLIKDMAVLIFGLCSWILGIWFCGYLIYVRLMSLKSPNNPDFYR